MRAMSVVGGSSVFVVVLERGGAYTLTCTMIFSPAPMGSPPFGMDDMVQGGGNGAAV
jgi:hypothetical protein